MISFASKITIKHPLAPACDTNRNWHTCTHPLQRVKMTNFNLRCACVGHSVNRIGSWEVQHIGASNYILFRIESAENTCAWVHDGSARSQTKTNHLINNRIHEFRHCGNEQKPESNTRIKLLNIYPTVKWYISWCHIHYQYSHLALAHCARKWWYNE